MVAYQSRLWGPLLFVISLALCEVAARLIFPFPTVYNFNRIQFTKAEGFGGLDEVAKTGGILGDGFSDQPRKPLRNVKIAWISDPDGFEEIVTLNLYGFRGENFAIVKPAGTTRVMFLGDSFVEGFGAADGETIPIQFEHHLDDPSLEALNLGIGGADLTDIARLASVAIPLLSPDYVIVVLSANDLPASPLDKATLPRDFKALYHSWLAPRIVRLARDLWVDATPALFYHRGPFQFYSPVPHPSNPLTGRKNTEGIPPRLFEAMQAGRFTPFTPSSGKLIEERMLSPLDGSNGGRGQLEAIRDLCRSQGTELLVALIPFNVTVSDHYLQFWWASGVGLEWPSLAIPEFRRHREHLDAMLADLGVPFIATTDALAREEMQGRRLYHYYDGHMNAAGYRLVAEVIADAYRKEARSTSTDRISRERRE